MLLYVCEEQFTRSLLCWCQVKSEKDFFLNKEDSKCHATQHSNTTIWNGQPQESGPTSPWAMGTVVPLQPPP